ELQDFVPRQPAPAPVSAPEPAPVFAQAAAAAPALQHRNGDMQDTESANVLSDILSELQEENPEADAPEEDPETHYNLGIAFKEMGLLDEAIGELQKVCHAIEHGHPFDQSMQAYTWLAQCLVDKGVPQAAVRWYEKALNVKTISEDGRLAVNYDLGCAYEMAGNQKK